MVEEGWERSGVVEGAAGGVFLFQQKIPEALKKKGLIPVSVQSLSPKGLHSLTLGVGEVNPRKRSGQVLQFINLSST